MEAKAEIARHLTDLDKALRQNGNLGPATAASFAILRTCMCEALLRIDAMRRHVRSAASGAPAASSLSPAVAELVATGRPPRIDPVPRLLIFGFDAAQRDDPAWKAHRDRLEKEFGLTVRAIGNTRGRVAAAFG